MLKRSGSPSLDISVDISAPSARVLRAFFDVDAMRAWWQVTHAVVSPRPLGPYAVEWQTTTVADDVLGRLGGVFHGTVMQFDEARGFFVADAYWLPPDTEPIGPMAFEVRCTPGDEGMTRVRVMQRGFEKSERWRRYYELLDGRWTKALASLKALLDPSVADVLAPRG